MDVFYASLFFLEMFFYGHRHQPKTADAIFYNGNIYTVDSDFHVVQAIAIKNGKIIATGTFEEILKYKSNNIINLHDAFVYPGFIDAHCHFYGYAVDLKKINLTGTSSFNSVLDTLVKYRQNEFMRWLFARGWDQNDWEDKSFPDNTKLDSLFPDVPVFLMRIDGHAALVNSKVLALANVTASTKINGGEIILKNGKPTGLLIDNAVDLVKTKIPDPSSAYLKEALINAQQNCFRVGLTTVDDAGLELKQIILIDSLQKSGDLNMRIYGMALYNELNIAYFKQHGRYKTDYLNIRSIKLYGDGALGSRGACMMQQYTDQQEHFGFLLSPIDTFKKVATLAKEMGFQLNTHCIGDSANRLFLNIYGDVLKKENDLRWRIEHAQVIAPDDFSLFKKFSIIPSVQPTHATSDMYWAADRIGNERMKGAYAYKLLLQQNGKIANGSDFPVEDINPMYGFYAAVVRKDKKGFPANGFQVENAITREQALRAMTIWAAYANFEEREKGSIEPGKFADFVVTDKDLMKEPDSSLFNIKVVSTYIAGKKVY